MPSIDVPKIAKELRELASASTGRSETAQLADLIDDIEAALARGVPRVEVLNHLNRNGFTMTIKSFDNALYRVRKRSGRASTRNEEQPRTELLQKPVGNPPSTAPQTPKAETLPPKEVSDPERSSNQTKMALGRRPIKTLDELAKEFPNLTRMQLIKMEAQQYDARPPSLQDLDALALRYGPKSKA